VVGSVVWLHKTQTNSRETNEGSNPPLVSKHYGKARQIYNSRMGALGWKTIKHRWHASQKHYHLSY
jgi:hypothetical protein